MGFVEWLKKPVHLLSVSGVPVRADRRWFLVIALVTFLIAFTVSRPPFGIDILGGVVIGLAVNVIFFVSIFLHEYSHAAIARIEGLKVMEIVLHPFGGITRFHSEPETPRAEFRIAIAGPVASFFLAIAFVGLGIAGGFGDAPVLIILGYALGILNFLIAIFNLLPGFPLDGGRVLRSYLWRTGRNLNDATILTGRFGQAIALVLILLGVIIAVFRQEFLAGIWCVLSGLFLFDSARKIIEETKAYERLLVDDVMRLPIVVRPDSTIQHFIDNVLSIDRAFAFPVVEERNMHGILILDSLNIIDRAEWRTVRVREIMIPVTRDHFVELGTSLAEAEEYAQSNKCGFVGVVNHGGKLVGVIHAKQRRR